MSTANPARSSPGYELPRRKPYSTVLGSIIVIAIIVAYVGSLLVIDFNMDAGDEIPHGTVIDVVAGVSYVPVDGFSYDNGRTSATGAPLGIGPATSFITRSAEEFSVTVRPWIDSLDELIERTKDEIETNRGIHLFTSNGTYQNAHGIEFTTFGFNSVDVNGRVWINLNEDVAIVVVASAPTGEFFRSFDDFEDMADSIEQDPEATASE